MSTIVKKLLSILLVLTLAVTSVLATNVVHAEDEEPDGTELTWEVVDNDPDSVSSKLRKVSTVAEEKNTKNSIVRVSIVLEGDSTLDRGYSAKNIAENQEAMSYRATLKDKQDEIANVISKRALEGDKLDVVWNLTLAANIISANVPEDKIDEIKAIKGVKDVFVETQYYPVNDEIVADDPNMTVATGMTAANYAWAAGYTGIGSRIAIVDTGLDIEHQSFDPTAFDLAIQEYESVSGKDVELMGKRDVWLYWEQLNASQYYDDYSNAYVNTKVPYGFNYVDRNFDIIHINDKEGEHGSHVAGIAAANKYLYVKNDDGSVSLKNSFDTVRTVGNAPDAQVFVMKVFGTGGGAYDSDYFAAIEDAIVMQADSVNLSLGSSVAGFTTNSTYQDIIDRLPVSNTVWANSAGNNGAWADNATYGMLYAEDVNFASGGSPATYSSTMSVASVDNDGFTGPYLIFNDKHVYYTETSGYGNPAFTTIAGEYEYVLLDGPGVDDNNNVGQEGDDFLALGPNVVTGKIAICRRGSSSFFAKANAAAAQGAAAVIIINNQAGTISMNLKGYLYGVPVVSVTTADGNFIMNNSELVEGGEELPDYYTGSIEVGNIIETVYYDEDYYTMSDFSSFGVPGNLSMKPEITTPGGNIYSLFGYSKNSEGVVQGGHDMYENMSGTSMASPQLAGIVGLMAQYVQDADENTGLSLEDRAARLGLTRRALIQSLLMSTAEPLFDKSGYYYSVLNQGSGLADVEAAINSNVVVLMNSTAVNGEERVDISYYANDGKVKAELGDDPERTGRYSVEFTLNNVTDEGLYYDLSADMFTQDLYYYGMFRDIATAPLTADIAWFVDGDRFVKEVDFDFNGDEVFDEDDAQTILDYVAGNIADFNDMEYADLDNDLEITSHDAYEALKIANQGAAYVPANGTVTIRADIILDQDDIYDFDVNGAYVEGYIYAAERDSADGEIGVVHSIPVLGFYGSWSEASMIDVGSAVEYDYDLQSWEPYMYAPTALGEDALGAQALIGRIEAFNANYPLGGNPLGAAFDNGEYYPERNAFNSNNVLVGAQYTLIRNASGYRYRLLDENGVQIEGTEAEGYGNMYAAYYAASDGTWHNTVTSTAYNYRPEELEEGDKATLEYKLAPEYYLKDGSIDWDEVADTAMSFDFTVDNTAPIIRSVFGKRDVGFETVIDEESGEETQVPYDDIIVTVSAADNEYIAGVYVYEEFGEVPVFATGSREGAKTSLNDNEDYVIVIDGTDVSSHLYVEVWDYAANVTTVQINLNKDELDQDVTIWLDQEYVKTVVNSPYKLTATVYPWGGEDQDVIWTSSDESVAVVNENGIVTGVAEGRAVITATAHADETASASCEFEFIKIEKELKGFVWDEEGQVWLSKLNTAAIPEYEKLSDQLRAPIASATYTLNGKFYGITYDSEKDASTIYEIDEDTFEVTKVVDTVMPVWDTAPATAIGENGQLYAYYKYILFGDATDGQNSYGFDVSRYIFGTYIIGLAYESPQYYPGLGMIDWVLLIDNLGNVYEAGLILESGRWAPPSLIGSTGYTTDTPYYQSLYFDGEAIYWSRYVASSNKVDLIYSELELDEDNYLVLGDVYRLGSYADGVWPVGGLFNDFEKEIIGIESSSERHANAVFEEAAVEVVAERPNFETPVVKGVTDVTAANDAAEVKALPDIINEKIETEIDGEYDTEDNDIVVVITADAEEGEDYETANTKNGLYEVTYDPDIMEFSRIETRMPYKAVNVEDGKIVFAFADLGGVNAGDDIVKVHFERISTDKTDITVTEKECNSEITHDAEPEPYVIHDPTEDFGEILPGDRPEFEADIPEGIWLSPLEDKVYNGKAQTQEFRVYDYKTLLVEGKDYTVKYKNNTNAGTATVTVKGKGNYKESKAETFEIFPAEIDDKTVVLLKKDAFKYNGKEQKPVVKSVTHNGVKLGKNDYTVTYVDDNYTEPGLHFVRVDGKGNYTGEHLLAFFIYDEGKDASTLKISGVKDKVYTGEEITQDVVVKDGKTVLTEGVDYDVYYIDNVDAGTAYVTVVGSGTFGEGEYVGSITKTFKIKPVKLTAKNTTVEGLDETYPYCGLFKPDTSLFYGDLELEEWTDYTVTLKNNDKVGTASITYKGMGNYSGSFTKTFKIVPIPMAIIFTEEIPDQPYQKGGNKPDVKLFDPYNEVALVLNKDYTLSYKNNTALGKATVTIQGKGNYTGTLKKEFNIVKSTIGELTATAPDMVYANKANNFKAKITITDTNGKKLVAGTDYDKNVKYFVNGNEVADGAILPAGTEVTVVAAAKGNYEGTVSATFRIVKTSIAKAKVTIPAQEYTGKPVTLNKEDITVKVKKVTLGTEEFEIVSYSNNVDKGTATVTLKGLGNYGCTKTVKFKIGQRSFIDAIWDIFSN